MQTESQMVLFIAAGMVGFVALLAVAWHLRAARYIVLGMMFMSGLGAPWDHTGYFRVQTWLLPLQTHRATIYLGFGVILIIAGLIHFQRCSARAVGGQAWMMLAISMYAGLLWMVHEPFVEGLQTLLFLAGTVIPLAFVVPALMRKHRDWDAMIGLIIMMNILSIGAVFVQFMVNRDLLMVGVGRRFTGMLGNPQHAAILYAVCSIIVLSVLLHTSKYRYWWFLVGLLAVNLVLLGWTGSRTGALMFVVGVTAILYRRVGRGILLLPLGAVAAWIAYIIATRMGVDVGIERLISTQDTRTDAWIGLWNQGMENFALGAGISERLDSENSYLTAFATFGFWMLVMVCLLPFVAAVQCWRLFRISRVIPSWGRHTDLIIAYNAMFFIGAIFEGYIIARISFPFLVMLVFAGMGGRIIQLYHAGELQEFEEEEYYEFDEESALEYGESAEPSWG